MPIKRITSVSTTNKYLEKRIEENNRRLLQQLQYVGESCLIKARTDGSYTDQTGNLRNSIGYVIADNRSIVSTAGFSQNGEDGKKTATQKAVDTKGDNMVLVVASGMNYASYVAAKGYDVLDSAELIVPRLMKQLGFKRK